MNGFLARTLLTLILVSGLASAALARDKWVQVRSKNFLLIGNASEKDIRDVAEHLEHFRSALGRLLNTPDLSSPIATNVIVFKDDASYAPYKPLKQDGKIDS